MTVTILNIDPYFMILNWFLIYILHFILRPSEDLPCSKISYSVPWKHSDIEQLCLTPHTHILCIMQCGHATTAVLLACAPEGLLAQSDNKQIYRYFVLTSHQNLPPWAAHSAQADCNTVMFFASMLHTPWPMLHPSWPPDADGGLNFGKQFYSNIGYYENQDWIIDYWEITCYYALNI